MLVHLPFVVTPELSLLLSAPYLKLQSKTFVLWFVRVNMYAEELAVDV